jgi:hypothetical protein
MLMPRVPTELRARTRKRLEPLPTPRQQKRERAQGVCDEANVQPNAALSGRGPIQHQETRWPVPAVRLNA